MAGPYGVVIVPGIGGTQLSYKGGQGGKTPLWWNPTAIVANTPLALGLANDGVSPWPIIGKKLFPDGPVDFGIYEPLITQLANDGLNPIFWPYDWRLALPTLATRLALYLASEDLTNPFYLVCHSMGGLVARLAYPTWLAQGSGKTWATTAYLGSPHGGSYWASAMLAGLYDDGCFLQILGSLLGLAGTLSPTFASALSVTGKVAGQLVGSWPALYSLLPSSQGIWAGIDPNAGVLSTLPPYAATPGGLQQQWLTLAIATAKSLAAPSTEPSPANRFNFVGDAPATIHRYDPNKSPGDILAYSTTSAGDRTVPQERATFTGAPTIQFKRTNHTALANTVGPLSRLASYLRNPPTADAVFSNDAPIAQQTGGSTIPFIPLTPVSFYNLTGDP